MPTVPIVPTQELQGGGFQPFSAGGAVEPVRDFSGAQTREMGAQMLNAGQVLGSIASKMQDEMDDAATKQAETGFLTQAQAILRGENGYLNSLGASAADPSGAIAALEEAQKEAEKGLTNDVQRLMFRQSASRNVLNFTSQITEHKVKQTREYATGESKARAERYTLEAANNFDSIGMVDADGNPTGPYTIALNTALKEANDAADLAMLPADSEQRKAMVRGVYSTAATGVVTNLMNSGRFLEAKTYIDTLVREGQLDGDTALKLSSSVDAGYDKQRGIEIGEAVYNGRTVGGTPAPEDLQNAITTIVPGAQVKPVNRRIPISTGTQPGRQPLQLEGMNEALIQNWELVQGDFGRALPVVSGKRDAATNAKAGGAKQSQHLDGNAIDVDTSGMSQEERIRLIKAAAARGFTGIGVYENSLHFDMRAGGPAMWGPSHGAESVPEWARGLRSEIGSGKPGNGRTYHVPNTSGDGFQSIDVQPIKGMAINDFVKLLRSQGVEVADIVTPQAEAGQDPIWHMAVKLPSQMFGARDGGVQVPTKADGKKDLAAMEAAIKAMNLEPDQKITALEKVRLNYEEDEKRDKDNYDALYKQATNVAYARVGGWQDIDNVTWGKLTVEDREKLKERPTKSDPDTVLQFLKNPQLGKEGTIEKYRHLLSDSDYQRFYGDANGPDAEKKIPEAAFDSDMFENTLIQAGQSALLNSKDDADKETLISMRDKFKALIDDEQNRRGKKLTRTEKQALLDNMLIEKAYRDNSDMSALGQRLWANDEEQPLYFMTPEDQIRAYVKVGSENIQLSKIPKSRRERIIKNLTERGIFASGQAIAEAWVQAGKPQ